MRNPFRLIRVRLTLWLVLSLALLLAAFSGGVYVALRYALRDNLDGGIESRSAVLTRVMQFEDGRPTLSIQPTLPAPDDEDGDEDDDLEDDEEFIRLFDSGGTLLLNTSDPDEEVPPLTNQIQDALAGNRQWSEVRGEDDSFRVLTVPIVQDERIVGALAVGQSEEDIAETLGSLLRIIVIAYPLTIISATLVGIFLAHRALAPIDRITQTARRLSAEDLSQRLDLDLPDDELGRLARTFDDMLARLDSAFRRQRQFTADASHELRTPLTIMKGEIEVALSRSRDASAYRNVLEATGEQADRLIDLVNSLLMLARADAGEIPFQSEPIEVGTAVETAVDQLRPIADAQDVTLSIDGHDALIHADLTLFLQLLFNLLENAIKHTPAGGDVRVTWSREEDRLHLQVIDTGSGIAAEHLPRVFDRFYRIDTARARSDGGAGIGLAICRWIVEAHGGTISVTSEAGHGSTFTVVLPAGSATS